MRQRAPLWIGLVLGLGGGWLAVDPPAPRHAGANSAEPPVGVTGAPGENTCSDCHGVAGDGTFSITAPAEYTPGQTYTVTVTLQDTGQDRWGFELTPLRIDPDTQGHVLAGSLTSADNLTTVRASGGRQYVSHTTLQGADGTFNGTPDGPVSWSFSWTAPGTGSGTVTFYAAGNAANGNFFNDAGDFIYTTTAASAEGPPTAVVPTTWGKIKARYR